MRYIFYGQGRNSPSTRFRVSKVAEHLERISASDQFEVNISRYGSFPPVDKMKRPLWLSKSLLDRTYNAVKSKYYDAALLHREMISTLYTAERFIAIPYIFDVDDSIWLNSRFGSVDKIARRANYIIAGNEVIADYFRRINNNIEIIPTGVETERFKPSELKLATKVIVWSGSSSGFIYLSYIQEALRSVLSQNRDVKLRIIADRPPTNTELNIEYEFLPWSPVVEVEGLKTASVGIMPLIDTEWARGKCSYKMLTYMSCAIPVVVSPVGMNKDVLSMGLVGFGASNQQEWIESLNTILNDREFANSTGRCGREIVLKNFDIRVTSGRTLDVLRRMA